MMGSVDTGNQQGKAAHMRVLVPWISGMLALSCARSALMRKAEPGLPDAPRGRYPAVAFYRPADCAGPRYVAIGHAKQGVLGELRRGSYFVQNVPAGEHVFWSFGERPGDGAAIRSRLPAGKIGVVEVCPTPGGRVRMTTAYPHTDHWNQVIRGLGAAERLTAELDHGRDQFARRHPDYGADRMAIWSSQALGAYAPELATDHLLTEEHGVDGLQAGPAPPTPVAFLAPDP